MNNINFFHRIQLPDGTYTPGAVMHGPDGGNWPTTRFGMPEDLTGKTVLDIGAWDGFFSFEAERRGARWVLATNPEQPKGAPLDGFKYAHKALSSNISLDVLDIEDSVSNIPIGQQLFDIVLFYGVLYHLKNPLGAMNNLGKLVAKGGICLLETAMAMDEAVIKSNTPLLEYQANFLGDTTNHFYPNEAWIKSAAKESGFDHCDLVNKCGSRSTYRLTKNAIQPKVYKFPKEVTQNTLVDYPRLKIIAESLDKTNHLHGEIAEIGVYKGGTAYLIASNTHKQVHLFDTFEGMPEVNEHDLHHKGDFADTSLEAVAGLLKDFSNIRLYKGLFPDTVTLDVKYASYSFVHIDVDIYQSVKDCLEFFSYRMVPGGIIVLDDYNAPSCPGAKLATDEFCAKMKYKLELTVQSQAIIRF